MNAEPRDAHLLDLVEALTAGRAIRWDDVSISHDDLRHLRLIQSLLSVPAVEPPEWPRIGEQWGPLRLDGELGRGGGGVVFLAHDGLLRRDVALKLVRPSSGSNESLLREGQRMASVRHPSVLTVHGAAEHAGLVGIWSDRILGVALSEQVEKGIKPGLTSLVGIGMELCGALAAIHAAGLLHGDVKPANVIRADDGRVVLVDFGSSTAIDQGDAGTGTPLYAAPERLNGDKPTIAGDLYGLGALLFALATGRPPIQARTMAELRASQRRRGETLLDLRPDLPHGFAALVERCLASDPASRPGSAGEAMFLLDDCLARHVGRASPTARQSKKFWIAAAAAIAIATLVAWMTAQPAAPSPTSIAVLPFADRSPAHDRQYLADGLGDELQALLAQVPQMHVAGQLSTTGLHRRGADTMEIGKTLGVASVLQGSVSSDGLRVHVSATLVDARDGFSLWTQSYERPIAEMLAVQDDIARRVVGKLAGDDAVKPMRAAAAQRSASAPAYDAYLRGRQRANTSKPEDVRAAAVAFREAIALDPKFAAAYANLALQDYFLADYAANESEWRSTRQEALAAADEALMLDPELALGYGARALLRQIMLLDWSGAEADYRRALARQPSDSETLRRYAVLQASLGHFDAAIATSEKALALDPLAILAWNNLARIHLAQGNAMPQARAALARALQLNPDATYPLFNLGIAELLDGQPRRALEVFQRLPANHHLHWAGTAMAAQALGDDASADAALQALLHSPVPRPYAVAMVYMARGDAGRAVDWLQQSLERREGYIGTLYSEPLAVRVRGDARFQQFLSKLGVPP